MALTQEQQNIKRIIQEHLKGLPDYVQEFYDDKKDIMSLNTLLTYIYQYEHFFNWLVEDAIVPVESPKDVPLDALDRLEKAAVKTYFNKLEEENIASPKKKQKKIVEVRKETSLNLPKSALRSLFNYLANESEDRDGNTYIDRNVMLKFPLKKPKVSETARAESINKKILKDDQLTRIIPFLEEEYEHLIADNTRTLNQFKKNRERDLSIIHLFIGSGLRVGELGTLEIENVDFENNRVFVVRKGGVLESVPVAIDAMHSIRRYLDVRNTRYVGAEDVPFLFVTDKGRVKEISRRAIQDLVEKYTGAFLNNKGITPHKLRHSFALEYQKRNPTDLLLLSKQLGHTNLNTTRLYVNMSDQEGIEAMERYSEGLNKEVAADKE